MDSIANRPLRPERRTSRRGMSLVEAVMSLTIVVAALSGVTLTTLTVSNAHQQVRVAEQLDTQGRRVLEFLAGELHAAQRSGIFPQPVPPFGSPDLRYRLSVGLADGEQAWSTPRRVRWVLEDGELDDGLDNNGNGLVDERAVLWVRDEGEVNERRSVRAHWVRELLEGEVANGEDDNGNGLIDEPGLCFWLEGTALHMAISLEAPSGQGRFETRTVRSRIRIKN